MVDKSILFFKLWIQPIKIYLIFITLFSYHTIRLLMIFIHVHLILLFQLLYNRFFSGKSDVDSCTLYSDRTLINRRNVTSDPKSSYRPNRDFFLIVLKSRVIAAAMTILGIESKISTPSKFPIPSAFATKAEKQKYLMEISTSVVDKLSLITIILIY